jgi:hypothetical protein
MEVLQLAVLLMLLVCLTLAGLLWLVLRRVGRQTQNTLDLYDGLVRTWSERSMSIVEDMRDQRREELEHNISRGPMRREPAPLADMEPPPLAPPTAPDIIT